MRELLLLMLLPGAASSTPASGVREAIVELCEYRWPEFRHERHRCISDQWQAYAEIAGFASRHCLAEDWEDVDAFARQGDAAAQIYADCSERWPGNYRALASCLSESERLGSEPRCGGGLDLVVGLNLAADCNPASPGAARARRLLRSTERGKMLAALWRMEQLGCLQ